MCERGAGESARSRVTLNARPAPCVRQCARARAATLAAFGPVRDACARARRCTLGHARTLRPECRVTSFLFSTFLLQRASFAFPPFVGDYAPRTPIPYRLRAARSLLSLFRFLNRSEPVLEAKIALFLYNAHIHRSYCNLVRSRSPLSAGKSIFTVAEHRRAGGRGRTSRGNLLGRKSRAAINSPLKRNRSGTF